MRFFKPQVKIVLYATLWAHPIILRRKQLSGNTAGKWGVKQVFYDSGAVTLCNDIRSSPAEPADLLVCNPPAPRRAIQDIVDIIVLAIGDD